MNGDVHVGFCERRGAKLPPATHLGMSRSTTHRYVITRVPRTQKEDRCRTSRRMWCCMRDGGAGRLFVRRPSVAVFQEEAANRPELLRSRAVVVSVAGEGVPLSASGMTQ
jgi:hypothetical protein